MCMAFAQDGQLVTKEQTIEIAWQYTIEERGKPESWFGGDADAVMYDGNWFVGFTSQPDEDGYVLLDSDLYIMYIIVSPEGDVLDYGESGVTPIGRTLYNFIKGVRNGSKKYSLSNRVSSANGGIGRGWCKPFELAKEFGCHETTNIGWVRQAKADQITGVSFNAPLTSAER